MQKKVLILCTGNSCRSIMFEALLNYYAGDNFIAYSAGSNPVGKVHPLSIKTLQKNNINTDGLYSKSWDEFNNQELDLVITVCDNAANESCPVFLRKVTKLHIGFSDPAKFVGNITEIEAEFMRVFDKIKAAVLAMSKISVETEDFAEQILTFNNNLVIKND